MNQKAEALLESLLGLSIEQRAEVATRLLESLDDLEPLPTDSWEEIVERRWHEIQTGKVQCRSAEEVLNEAESSLDK